MRAFEESAVLGAAIDLEIFTAIEEGAVTAPQIAQKCGASERGIRMLCDNLVTRGLLVKTGNAYEMMEELLRGLPDCVRKGGTQLPAEGTVIPDNPMWVTFARTMAPLMYPASQAIASHVPATGPLKVLDIAAGHGLFGIAIAQRNPDAEIVALDWAAVLEVAKENAVKAGVADRYRTIAGSAFDAEFGSEYDVVLVTNFLHHFDPPTGETVLRKVCAALKPGGRAITLEYVPNEDRVSPPFAARFAVIMLSSTQRGDAYTFGELDSMLRNAGFAANVCHQLPTEQSIIISTK
jgi:SAM-dependent methyltransferase